MEKTMKTLKLASILLIVVIALLAVITGSNLITGTSEINTAISENGMGEYSSFVSTLIYLTVGVAFVRIVAYLFLAIRGLSAANCPTAASGFITFAIVVLVITAISAVGTVNAGIINLLINVISIIALVLYIISAKKIRSAVINGDI